MVVTITIATKKRKYSVILSLMFSLLCLLPGAGQNHNMNKIDSKGNNYRLGIFSGK